jgi:hypothetical protein
MPHIDPRIVEQEITTYPDVKPVRHKLLLVNPCKEATIKAEVENTHQGWFHLSHEIERMGIEPCSFQQESRYDTRMYGLSCDMNKYFPKDNFPTPFIDQIVDDCVDCEVFYFMDGFFRYN